MPIFRMWFAICNLISLLLGSSPCYFDVVEFVTGMQNYRRKRSDKQHMIKLTRPIKCEYVDRFFVKPIIVLLDLVDSFEGHMPVNFVFLCALFLLPCCQKFFDFRDCSPKGSMAFIREQLLNVVGILNTTQQMSLSHNNRQ